jgi:hypothetical protein
MNPILEQSLREKTTAIALDIAIAAGGESMDMDTAAYGQVIEAAHVVADEGRTGLQRWVDAGRRAGLSWSEIGEALGVSKQAAQQRFGGPSQDDPAVLGETLVRLGASAFNEQAILDAEGAKGRELVRVAMLALAFRPTDHAWEHRRVVSISRDVAEAKLAGGGWRYVTSWGLFHYFKRPTARLAA